MLQAVRSCAAALLLLGCAAAPPVAIPPRCEAPPLQGVIEYEQLLDAQMPDPEQSECDPDTSLLRIPASGRSRERRCLNGLDDLLATYERACAALDRHIDELGD